MTSSSGLSFASLGTAMSVDRGFLGDGQCPFREIAVDTKFVRSENLAGGGAALPQLLALSEPATAALCFNDVVAIGLMPALAAAGVAVGKDFSVIGFDDIEEAKHTYPALTSVAVNGRNLGARAAQLLMRRLASGDFDPETVLCPVILVVRASSGAAPTDLTGAQG
jgi:DNA-binding LacI/PurR family transcriptional regulator